jgi:tRNA(Ile)-lysidine synthase
LRGDESDEDANFVRTVAQSNTIPYFEKSFDTIKLVNENKLSVQEAARELRYRWFEEIATKENFQYYATAHHFDDQLETFFINLFRGTGVKGLRGIKPKNGKCIRPLLFATRDEISGYAAKYNILYREDSSNRSEKYLRNRIRHQIIPALASVKSDYKTGFSKTFQLLSGVEKFIDDKLDKLRNDLLRYREGQVYISMDELNKLTPAGFYLHELLHPFGFNMDATGKIPDAMKNNPGKIFLSKTHQLLIDRYDLIISPTEKALSMSYFIEAGQTEILTPLRLKLESFNKTENTTIDPGRNVAQFDLGKIEFPLKLRRWEEGDFFYPFGMKGKKKVSDYFTDRKFSLFEKQKTWILLSGENIIWIVGHRVDNRYKIDQQTISILKITLF